MKKYGKGYELLQVINRKSFDELCKKWEIDKKVRKFFAWDQICCLVMAYVLRLESLREVEQTLLVCRSTLSDTIGNRPPGFYQELCELILKEISFVVKSSKTRRAINNLLSIDSTQCYVHPGLARLWPCGGVTFRSSVKLHTVWNIDGEWIEDFRITSPLINDSPVAKQFKIKSGYMYVFDRGYRDLELWYKIVDHGSHFVSRLCDHIGYRPFRKKTIQDSEGKVGVLWDGEFRPSKANLKAHPLVSPDIVFRRIIYRDVETKKVFDFITSDFSCPAQQVADIYKRRWSVELLFRWLKGHLSIRYFPFKNRNAIRIQLSIAVLVQLLVQLLRLKTKFKGTLWECLRYL